MMVNLNIFHFMFWILILILKTHSALEFKRWHRFIVTLAVIFPSMQNLRHLVHKPHFHSTSLHRTQPELKGLIGGDMSARNYRRLRAMVISHKR